MPYFVDNRGAAFALSVIFSGVFSGLCAPSALAGVAGVGEAIELAAHRAVYDLSLDKAADGTGIANLSGRIVFETAGSSCEGYTETLRFVTRSQLEDGSAMITDLQSTTYEHDGIFDFAQRTLVDGNMAEDIRGNAMRADGGLQVDLVRPEKKRVSLAGAPLFPARHLQNVIAAAQRGAAFVSADVFDGSEDGETVSPVTAVIGAKQADGGDVWKDDAESVDAIGAHVSWPVVFAYFDPSTRMQEAPPAYQMSSLLYDNGIIRKLRFDYGNYSINGALTEIEFFDQGPCPLK